LGTPLRNAFIERTRELADGDGEVMAMVAPLLSVLSIMLKDFACLTRQISRHRPAFAD